LRKGNYQVVIALDSCIYKIFHLLQLFPSF
jgi:hypothetical protein